MDGANRRVHATGASHKQQATIDNRAASALPKGTATMSASVSSPAGPPPQVLASGRPLRILILFEDEPLWRRVSITVAQLRRELQHGLSLRVSSWRFPWLYHPKMLRMAAAEAETADMLLVFHCANHALTAGVKACIRAWQGGQASEHAGLLAVCETTTNRHHPTVSSSCPMGSQGNGEHGAEGGSRFMNHATE